MACGMACGNDIIMRNLIYGKCGEGKRRNEFAEWLIMRNLIYGKWRKERNSTGKHARVSAALFLAPI